MANTADILTDLEIKFNTFDFSTRGIKIWWICRQKLYEALTGRIVVKNSTLTSPRSSKIKKLYTFAGFAKSLNWKVNNYKHFDILCISNTTSRRMVDGKYFDIIFDYIGKYDSKDSYAVLNTLSEKGFLHNHYTENCYNMANLSLMVGVYRRFYKKFLKPEEIEKIRLEFDKISGYIKEKYNISIDVSEIVLQNTSMLVMTYKYAYKILKKIMPQVLYVECAYSPTHMVFVYAAKKLNIKVVEFQHGLISSKHLGYMYNNQSAKDSPIPDYVCVYGAYFKKLIQEINPGTDVEIIEYGYPYMYERVIETSSVNQQNKPYDILVTTQGAIYAKLWCSFIKGMLQQNSDLKILIKPHPNETNEYKELYSDIINHPGITFEYKQDIYTCLQRSRIHISCFSTCHYEALSCNVPTCVVKLPGWQHVDALTEYGVSFFDSPQALIQYIMKGSFDNIQYDRFKSNYFNITGSLSTQSDLKKNIIETNRFFIG